MELFSIRIQRTFQLVSTPLFSYLALVQIWEQYNYIQMRNYYTLVHIMLSCEVM